MRRRASAVSCLALGLCLGAAGAPATASVPAACDLADHRVNVYNTTVAAAFVERINAARAARDVPPLAIDEELWMKAMWRAGRSAASRTLAFFPEAPDPCAAPRDPLARGRAFSRVEDVGELLEHPTLTDTGALERLLAPEVRSIGVGIAFAWFHTMFEIYVSGTPAARLDEAPPSARGEAVRVTAGARLDLAPTLLANDQGSGGFVHVVSARAAFGAVELGWASRLGRGVFYAPARGRFGGDTIQYVVADAFGRTAAASAAVAVTAAPEAGLGVRLVGPSTIRRSAAARARFVVTALIPTSVTLALRRGATRVGVARTIATPTGALVRLRELVPRRVRPGRYELVVAGGAETRRLRFRIV